MAATFYPSEKRPVILQLGKCFTKVGFGSEPQPRAIFRSPELQSEQTMELGTSTLNLSGWDAILEPLMRKIYFHYLQVVPADRRVILLENDFMPTVMRESLSRILFEHLRVPSVVYLSEMVTPLYTCGISSGIVVDIGFKETRVLPVAFGVPVYSAYKTISIGCQTINHVLRELLQKSTEQQQQGQDKKMEVLLKLQLLPDTILEDIKSRCCYVRFILSKRNAIDPDQNTKNQMESDALADLKNENDEVIFESKNDLVYHISNEHSLTIPAKVRWEACECLFTPPIPPSIPDPRHVVLHDGIVEAIIASIEVCPMDIKRHVLENLLLCGGGAELKGVLHRITYDLSIALEKHPTLSSLANKLTIGRPDFSPLLLQWIGAAAASVAIECVEEHPNEVILTQWEAGAPLPDWTTPPEGRVIESETTEQFLAAVIGRQQQKESIAEE